MLTAGYNGLCNLTQVNKVCVCVFILVLSRYVKDAPCGSLFEDMDINGVTEIKLKLLKRSEAINQTSVQALGYIGEQGKYWGCRAWQTWLLC